MNLNRIAARHLVSLTQPLRMRRDYGSTDGNHWGAYESEPKRPLFWDRPLTDAVHRAKFWADRRGEVVLIFKGPRPSADSPSTKPVKRVGPPGEALEVGIEPEALRPSKPAPWPF